MKLFFDVADIGENQLQAFPSAIEGCCRQSLVWFMRRPKGWNVKNAFIIDQIGNKPDGTPLSENYYFCQYCGARHEAHEINDPLGKHPLEKATETGATSPIEQT